MILQPGRQHPLPSGGARPGGVVRVAPDPEVLALPDPGLAGADGWTTSADLATLIAMSDTDEIIQLRLLPRSGTSAPDSRVTLRVTLMASYLVPSLSRPVRGNGS